MITLDDIRQAEIAVKRQERVVATRQKRVREEEDALAILKTALAERAAQYASQQA